MRFGIPILTSLLFHLLFRKVITEAATSLQFRVPRRAREMPYSPRSCRRYSIAFEAAAALLLIVNFGQAQCMTRIERRFVMVGP